MFADLPWFHNAKEWQ